MLLTIFHNFWGLFFEAMFCWCHWLCFANWHPHLLLMILLAALLLDNQFQSICLAHQLLFCCFTLLLTLNPLLFAIVSLLLNSLNVSLPKAISWDEFWLAVVIIILFWCLQIFYWHHCTFVYHLTIIIIVSCSTD